MEIFRKTIFRLFLLAVHSSHIFIFKLKIDEKLFYLPRPLLPTNRKSLNLATEFFMTAVQFLSSPHQFSSLPAFIVTIVPSPTSANATTLNATGSVLFERQCVGNAEHKIYGLPVRTANSLIYKVE